MYIYIIYIYVGKIRVKQLFKNPKTTYIYITETLDKP